MEFNNRLAYISVALAGLISGLVVFGGKIFINSGMSVYEISIIPFVLALILLVPFLIFNKKFRLKRWMLPVLIMYGLMAAITILAEYGALALGASVGIVVLLLYTQPLWTILFTKLFLKEKVKTIHVIAGILVVAGVVMLVNPFSQARAPLIGVIVGLIGGIGLSGWIVAGSVASKKKIHPVISKFADLFFSIIIMLLLYPLFLLFHDTTFTGFSLNKPLILWVYLILYGIFAILINNLLYLKGVEKVPTVAAGIIMLLEPVSAVILSTIFLHEPITEGFIIGGALILFANYLVIKE